MHPAKPHRVLNLTWRGLLAAALCQILAATALYAQISNASINGTVRDPTGAVVPETAILLRNTATGVESRTITNDQGIYIFLNILPGNYTLEGSKPGFSTNRLEPFNLVVNQRSVFGIAAIWDRWSSAEDDVIEGCSVISVAANALVAGIADPEQGMPAILRRPITSASISLM